MHLGETKVMCNPTVNKTDININGRKIEEVDNYIYLGQMVAKDHDQEQGVETYNRSWLDCFWQAGLHYAKQKNTTEVENKSAQ